jgi:hypothetical protein
MEARAGWCERRKGKKFMPLSYGCGEEFYEYRGKREERTYQFWKK